MEIGIIFWILFAILVGAFWQSKGRGFGGGFVVSLLLSPLVGFIIGLVLKPDIEKEEIDQIQSGTMKKCPYCAELIKREAIVCRYCSRELPIEEEISEPDPVMLSKRKGFKCPHCSLALWLSGFKKEEISVRKNDDYAVNCYYCHKKVIVRKEKQETKTTDKLSSNKHDAKPYIGDNIQQIIRGVMPVQQSEDITSEELERLKKRTFTDPGSITNYAYLTENDWICVCGTHNQIDFSTEKQNCNKCGRDRNFVLNTFIKPSQRKLSPDEL